MWRKTATERTHTHIFVFRLNYKSSVRAACFDQLLAFVALRSLFVRTLFLERISSDFSRLIKSPSLTLSSKVFLLYTYIYVLGVTEICQSYKQSFATVSEKKTRTTRRDNAKNVWKTIFAWRSNVNFRLHFSVALLSGNRSTRTTREKTTTHEINWTYCKAKLYREKRYRKLNSEKKTKNTKRILEKVQRQQRRSSVLIFFFFFCYFFFLITTLGIARKD